MAFALYSEAELARLTRVFQDTNAADAQIRQHLSTIASLLKESESKQAHDIVTTFCHIIDVLQDQQEHQVETLTCAIEQARACPIQYVPAPRQEQTRCPYEDPQDMLEEFYRHFVEKKSPSTMNDYVSRIKTFAHSPQYLGDMLESGELGVRELDNDPVMFTYEHIEQILARFPTKDEEGATIRQRNNIRSALRMLNQFKADKGTHPAPVTHYVAEPVLTVAPAAAHYVCADGTTIPMGKPTTSAAPANPLAGYISDLPPALQNGQSLKLAIPNGVTSIPAGAYHGRSDLSDIHIPDSVTDIGPMALSDCSALLDIQVSADNPCFSADGVALYNHDKTVLIRAIPSFCGRHDILSSVTILAPGAFENFGGDEIGLPDNLRKIGTFTFRDCPYVQEIRIPPSVEEIGTKVFSKCPRLKRIMVDKQNRHFFSTRGFLFDKKRTKLIRVPEASREECHLGKTVTTIEKGAFDGCTKLKSVICTKNSYDAVKTALTKAGLTTPIYIEDLFGALYTEDGTTLVKMLKNTREIVHVKKGTQSISRDFMNGGTVFIIKIPASVTDIHSNAFSHCHRLSFIVDPGSYAESYAISHGIRYNYSA